MNLDLKLEIYDLTKEENSLLEISTFIVKNMESKDNYLHLIHLSRVELLKEEIGQLLKQQELCYLRMMYQKPFGEKQSI